MVSGNKYNKAIFLYMHICIYAMMMEELECGLSHSPKILSIEGNKYM